MAHTPEIVFLEGDTFKYTDAQGHHALYDRNKTELLKAECGASDIIELSERLDPVMDCTYRVVRYLDGLRRQFTN